MDLPLVQYLLIYLASISLVTFLLFVFDKAAAVAGWRRVPEKVLFFFALLGGSIGAIVAMETVRHKTKKASFFGVLALILLLQIGVVGGLYYLWLNQPSSPSPF